MRDLTVQTACPDDVPAIRAFMLQIFERDYGYGYQPQWHWDYDDLQRVYLEHPRHTMMLAHDVATGALVGTAGIRSGGPNAPTLPDWLVARYQPPERTAQIVRVFVAAGQRRRSSPGCWWPNCAASLATWAATSGSACTPRTPSISGRRWVARSSTTVGPAIRQTARSTSSCQSHARIDRGRGLDPSRGPRPLQHRVVHPPRRHRVADQLQLLHLALEGTVQAIDRPAAPG